MRDPLAHQHDDEPDILAQVSGAGPDPAPVTAPATAAPVPPSRRRRWRWLRNVALLLLVGLGAAWVLRDHWLGPLLARQIAQTLDQEVGGRWQVGRVGGSYVGGLQISGLACLEAPPHSPLTRCRVGTLAVEYRLLEVLGAEPLLGLRSLRLAEVDVGLDTTISATPAQTPSVMPDLPWAMVVAVDGMVSVTTAAGVVRLEGLTVGGRLDRLRLDSSTASLSQQVLGALGIDLQHAGPSLLGGWTIAGGLGSQPTSMIRWTGSSTTADSTGTPRWQVQAELGEGNVVDAGQSADGLDFSMLVAADRLAGPARTIAAALGIEVPAQGSLELRGSLDQAGTVSVARAAIRLPGIAATVADARWRPDRGLIALDAARIEVWPGILAPTLAGYGPASAAVVIDALATDGELTALLSTTGWPGSLTATASAEGRIASAAWRQVPWRSDLILETAPVASGSLRLDRTRARMSLAGSGSGITVSIDVELVGLGHSGWQAESVTAGMRLALTQVDGHDRVDGDWRLSATGAAPVDRILVSDGRILADSAGLRLTLATTAPAVVRGSISSTIPFQICAEWLTAMATAPLVAEWDLIAADLADAAPWLPEGLLLSGQLSGHGVVQDVRHGDRWSGSLRLRQASLGGLPPLPPLLDIEASFRADQAGLVVEDLRARAGGGNLEARGRLPLPGQPGPLAMNVTSRDALIFQRPDVRLRADADLVLAGTWEIPALSGRIHLTDLVATTPISWFAGRGGPDQGGLLDRFPDLPPPWNRMLLDLRLTGGQSGGQGGGRALEIRNNVVVATLAVAVAITGTTRLPVLAGDIRCSGGRLSLPFSAYRIDSALIRINPADPYDPLVEATASAQMQGYALTVQVTGTLRHPQITVSSSPPLAPDDALVLASTGRLPAEVRNDGAAASAVSIAIPFIGRELQRWVLGDGFADDGDSVFDRLTIRYDEDRSDRGLPTTHLEYQLSGPWYLYGERDVHEAYNAGLLWRWVFNDPARAASSTRANAAAAELLAEWLVEPAPGVDRLPVSASALLDTVPANQRRGDDANQPAQLASAAQRMVDRLVEAGHPDSRVVPIIPEASDPDRRVRFAVTPGQPWQVATTLLSGAPEALAVRLQSIIAASLATGTAPTPQRLAAARNALRNVLSSAGFALARVELTARREPADPASLAAEVTIRVNPGLRYSLAVGAPVITDGELPPALIAELAEVCQGVHGQPWTRRQVVELRGRLMQILLREGHVFSKVVVSGDEPGAQPVVTCEVLITAGLPATLRTLTIHGLGQTSEAYVRRRLDLAEGARLRDGEPEAALDRLRRSGVVRSLSSTMAAAGEPSASQPVDLDIIAEEAPARSLELTAGYGSYEGLRGGALYRDTNLFGWGRTWELGGDLSQRSIGGRTRVIDRDLLGIERMLSLSLESGWREEPSFNRTAHSGELAVRAPLTRWLDLRTAYTVDAELATNREAGIPGAESDEFVLDASLSSELIWDGRDDRQLPTSGGVAQLGLGISDPALGSQVSYIELSSRLGWVVPLVDERLIAAVQVAGTVRQTTDGSKTLPIQYRMFLGGTTTVRSFGLDQLSPVSASGEALGGLTTAFANAELRARIAGNVHVAAFYDLGTVAERSWTLDGAVGHAIGAGLRYHLPIGPLRLDAAYNPGERWAADSSYAIDAAIGFTF